MSDPLTRPATPADLPRLLELVREYWDFEEIPGFAAASVEPVLRRLLSGPEPPGTILVAEASGVIEGYLVAVLVLSIEHGGIMGEIDELFVAPRARGRGLGAALLAAAELALIARGSRRVQLQLGRGNRAAREFYARRGYGQRAGFDLYDKPLP